uniref:VOC domain-containing protein n=1 Tax=Angiostrongylus cantonensis TaxID=6313 RepID=A0A0K0D2J5_ANGCA
MVARALHYVFKIGDRRASYDFFTKVLQMKVLRHEEFEEGCKAACNGPYNGKWSKTMVGYGNEDENFAIELTYNYEIGSYRLGNDLMVDPDGHYFFICPGEGCPKLVKVGVRVKDIRKSVEFWTNQLGMKIVEEGGDGRTTMRYREGQLPEGTLLDRASGYGRIAFSYPDEELPALQEKIKAAKLPIVKELVTLDTPGKASVQVIILADPDEHEICFVGDKAYRELSKFDPNADDFICKEMAQDNSASWFRNGKRSV